MMNRRQPDSAEELQAWIHDATIDLVRRARRRLSEEYTDHYFETYAAMRSQSRSKDDSHRAAMDALGNAHTLHLASLKLHGDPRRLRPKLAIACLGILLIGAAWYASTIWYPIGFEVDYRIISLHKAISYGDLAKIDKALDRADNLEAVDLSGRTPLVRALSTRIRDAPARSKKVKEDVLLSLLERGADWKTPFAKEDPFVIQAAAKGLDRTVAWLLHHGEAYTPALAIVLGESDRLEEQLERDPELAIRVVLPSTGLTLLHLAARAHDTGVIRMLLEHGANPNAKSTVGTAPLHEALLYGRACESDFELQHARRNIDLLLESGADVNAENSVGMRPIIYAMLWRELEILEILARYGADVTSSRRSNHPPIVSAISVEQLDFLIARGANINTQDSQGNTLLHRLVSRYSRSLALIRRVFDYGSNPNITNDRGRTPLHQLTQNYSGGLVYPVIGSLFDYSIKLFLEHGVDTSIQDSNGATAYSHLISWPGVEPDSPLAQHPTTPVEAILLRDLDSLTQHLETARQDEKNHWLNYAVASSRGELDMTRVLLENGADPNDYDPERYQYVNRHFYNYHTPLFFAVGAPNIALAELLLQYSADPHQRTDDIYGYETPLHRAADRKPIEFAKLLLANGADAYAKDTRGRTALDVATQNRSFRTEDFLRTYMEQHPQ